MPRDDTSFPPTSVIVATSRSLDQILEVLPLIFSLLIHSKHGLILNNSSSHSHPQFLSRSGLGHSKFNKGEGVISEYQLTQVVQYEVIIIILPSLVTTDWTCQSPFLQGEHFESLGESRFWHICISIWGTLCNKSLNSFVYCGQYKNLLLRYWFKWHGLCTTDLVQNP